MATKNVVQKIRLLKIEIAKLKRENKRLKKRLDEYESDADDFDDEEDEDEEDDF